MLRGSRRGAPVVRTLVFVAILLVVLLGVGFGLLAAIDSGGGEGDADLVPGAIAPDRGGSKLVVENDGKGDAGGFTVRVGDDEVRFDALPAKRAESRRIGSCSGRVAVVVDADEDVGERTEENNRALLDCPPPR